MNSNPLENYWRIRSTYISIMEPGDTVAVNDRLATEFELFEDWVEMLLLIGKKYLYNFTLSIFMCWISLLPKSPVNAFILIKFNIHDCVSITGFSPHKGAIWDNQMTTDSNLMFISGANLFTVVSLGNCFFIRNISFYACGWFRYRGHNSKDHEPGSVESSFLGPGFSGLV